jgi:hypothetical protein
MQQQYHYIVPLYKVPDFSTAILEKLNRRFAKICAAFYQKDPNLFRKMDSHHFGC